MDDTLKTLALRVHGKGLELSGRIAPDVPDALVKRVSRETALREIARCFLSAAGMTIPGELARVTGLSRPEAGRGNRQLVAEGFATMLAPGVYRLNGAGLSKQHALGAALDDEPAE